MNRVRPLQWDSDFFGVQVGRVDINSMNDGIKLFSQRQHMKEHYDLIYVFGGNEISLEENEAKLVDKKVVFSINNLPLFERNINVIAWPVEKGVSADLLQLALESGKYSRFKTDSQLPLGSYERLYTRWIEQSVFHTIATEVLCYMVDGIPCGMATIDIKDRIGTIGLVAIHANCQHQGIGTSLLRHVIRYARDKQCVRLSVATQMENVPACRLYKKCGMEIESITKIWHWWL